MYRQNRPNHHFEICIDCHKYIWGKLYDYKGYYIVKSRRRINGIGQQGAWIEHFWCLKCWKVWNDEWKKKNKDRLLRIEGGIYD